ncbi:uncharacterized protein PRCAT00005534001 [Priceomyces carsonii]|uniref:uncharacterized protein n=1 Tax=Priceomyces carsonii TaxID=28549 RepID=UPI002EDAC592|nr:unnamed protein product [Priceomyces carsonii]
MIFDLNVPWPVNNYTSKPSSQQIITLKNTIVTLYVLGYTHIAINFCLSESVKVPAKDPSQINPIQIAQLEKDLKEYEYLKLFTRITMTISDPSQCQGLSKLQNYFDIISIQPLTEKALQIASSNLDIDLISFNLSSRLPFFLKHKTVGSALEKGIKFEICYSNLISGPAGYTVQGPNENMTLSTTAALARKNFFNNVLQLIRASRSRGLVVSSGATGPLQTRNPDDILNLLKTLGLDHSRAKFCLTGNAERVLISGRLRIKSYKQTIQIDDTNVKGDVLINNDREDKLKKSDTLAYKKKLSDTSSGRLLKKQRTR